MTGYYGEVTEQAVKNFQSRNGLAADGQVGIQTMTKLTSDNVRRPAANSGGGSSAQTGGGSTEEAAEIRSRQEITAARAVLPLRRRHLPVQAYLL